MKLLIKRNNMQGVTVSSVTTTINNIEEYVALLKKMDLEMEVRDMLYDLEQEHCEFILPFEYGNC